MGGPGGAGSNPEQLFAAGYAACFESALRLAARLQRKPLKDAGITARVTLNLADHRRYLLGVELDGHLEGVSETEAQDLMRGAMTFAPIPM
jgi:lipoyl-dependent peroxiredoxin